MSLSSYSLLHSWVCTGDEEALSGFLQSLCWQEEAGGS